MAMVFWDGAHWKRISFARRALGADVYLCCPGPSLAAVEDRALHGPGRLVIAVNRAYPKVRPDFWIGSDHPACFDKGLLWEPFTKVLRMCWREHVIFGTPIKECPATVFVDVDPGAHPLEMFDRRLDNIVMPAPLVNSFECALHLAVWIGGQRIHLVGCDFGGATDYYDATKLTDAQRHGNRRLYGDQVRRLIHHHIEAGLREIDLLSCTADSPINQFMPYLPLADALKASAERLPKGWTPQLHARDAALCRWAPVNMAAPEGVVVGVIPKQAWALEWWWGNFRRHNPRLPVAFADFGLPPKWAKWCLERAPASFRVHTPDSVRGWFRKPFAILQAPFKKMLWLDLDTEVRAPVNYILKRLQDGQLVLAAVRVMADDELDKWRTPGWSAMLPPGRVEYDGGLIGVERGNGVIEEWATNCVPPREFSYRGDHEIMNVVLHRREADVDALTASDFSFRVRGRDPNARVIHHAGRGAKDQLRAALEGRPAPGPRWRDSRGIANMQRDETDLLLSLVDDLCQRQAMVRVLEVGVQAGGTARAILRRIVEKSRRFSYVGVDPDGHAGHRAPDDVERHGSAVMVTKRSCDAVPDVICAHPEGFDLVVIDGCHCQACATFDWRHYGPLVREGGYLAFHDCAEDRQNDDERQPNTPHRGIQVRPVYLAACEAEGWEPCGETGTDGLGCLRRVTRAGAPEAAASTDEHASELENARLSTCAGCQRHGH